MKRHGNNELAVKNFTTIATAKRKRRIENDTEEAIPTTVHDVRTPRTLATGRHRLRHRYRQTGRFATTPSMSANACPPRREGHVKAPLECGVQPLTQYSTVGASTFRGKIFSYFVEILTFIPSFRFRCYLCVLPQS
jgi:hypothetical protein